MARNTESDATYCSEIEKEEQKLIRRSKRLSQRNSLSGFRFNRDPIQRLYEIYQALKYGELSLKWLTDDWLSLKFEVESIQETLKSKHKGKVLFILKKINKNLEKLPSPNYPNESTEPASTELDQNVEQVKSPNILAGMMTENLTEFPPYQPQNLPENLNAGQISGPSIVLTQKNPLDLTRKIVENQVVPQRVLTQGTSETPKQQQQEHPTISTTPKRDVPMKQQQPKPKKTSLSIPKEPMIDLTEEHPVQMNRENISPQIIEQAFKPKSPVHVSKWLKFLPTQQRPKIPKRLFRETSASSAVVVGPSKDSTSLKNSIIRLYRDLPPAATSSLNTLQKTPTASCSKKSKNILKQNPPQIAPQTIQKCQKPFRNTETMIPRERDLPRIPPRNAQTETNEIISPDFLLDEFLDLNESDMNDSGTSLTPSLKEGFRKIFGTDKLNEVFGEGDEVVYELTENQIIRLANALNMDRGDLRKIIDNILSDENYGVIFEDGNIPSDSSSIVECSQSPPQRLFPSQRSQTSDGR